MDSLAAVNRRRDEQLKALSVRQIVTARVEIIFFCVVIARATFFANALLDPTPTRAGKAENRP